MDLYLSRFTKNIMKSVKRALTLLLVFIITMIFVGATPTNKKQINPSRNDGLIEPEYSNKRVIITIDKEKSLEFYKYSPQDFSEISCTNCGAFTLNPSN